MLKLVPIIIVVKPDQDMTKAREILIRMVQSQESQRVYQQSSGWGVMYSKKKVNMFFRGKKVGQIRPLEKGKGYVFVPVYNLNEK